MKRPGRPSLSRSEAKVGGVRVQYCAARRRSGEWVAVGSIVDENGTPRRGSALVSGFGSSENGAVERMMLRAAVRAGTEQAPAAAG